MNITYVLTSVLVSILFLTTLGSACSCIMPGTIQEEFDNHDAVFIGKVVSVDDKILSQTNTVRFDIKNIYKGQDLEEIRTPSSSASCGYNFEKEKEYLVYAREIEGKMAVSLCSRTSQVDEAQEDIDYLDSEIGDDYIDDENEELTLWQKITNFFKNIFT